MVVVTSATVAQGVLVVSLRLQAKARREALAARVASEAAAAPEFLGWARGITRFCDETDTSHIIVHRAGARTGSVLCGTHVMWGGVTRQCDAPGHECLRCLAAARRLGL